MKNKKLAFQWAPLLAITASTVALGQYFPPSGGGTGPTTNPVSIAQGGTGAATAPANSYFGNNTGSTAAPSYITFPAVGTGTVTNVATGTGLTGGPITTTGTISLANIGTNTVLGSIAGGAPAALTKVQLTTLVNPATDLLSGGIPALTDAQIIVGKTGSNAQAVTITGDITFTNAGVGTLKNTGPGVTSATYSNVTIDAQGRVTALSSGAAPTGTVTSVAFTGDGTIYNAAVTGSPVTTSGTFAPTLHTQAASTFFGNGTGSTATPVFMTNTVATAALNQFTATLQGVVPLSGGGTINFLRADGIWVPPSGSGTITASPQFQLASYSAAGTSNTLTGMPYFVDNNQAGWFDIGKVVGDTGVINCYAGTTTTGLSRIFGGTTGGQVQAGGNNSGGTGAAVLQGSTTVSGQLTTNGSTSGSLTWTCPAVAGSGTVFTGPTVALTEITGAAAVNNSVVLQSTAGARSTSAAAYKPGLYGDGADGATTTWTRPDLNATTLAVSSTTGPTTFGRITIQCTSTADFNASTLINLNGLGYAGGEAARDVAIFGGDSGTGPASGQGGVVNASATGPGNGGAGGGGSITGGVGTGAAGAKAVPLGLLDMGSGGAGGSGTGNITGAGGAGGGYGKLMAAGAIILQTSAVLKADGNNGASMNATATGCPSGGAGGTWFFGSDTSINLAAGTVSAKGGTGGAATGSSTGQGGAGGGGGQAWLESPSNINSLVTAAAFAGGAGGAAGTAGAAGGAGFNGIITLITGKPNAPLISWLERGDLEGFHLVRTEVERISYDAGHGREITHSQLAEIAASYCDGNSQIMYVALMGGNADFGFGIYDYGKHCWVVKCRREDVA